MAFRPSRQIPSNYHALEKQFRTTKMELPGLLPLDSEFPEIIPKLNAFASPCFNHVHTEQVL
jgi:hypothetical protein